MVVTSALPSWIGLRFLLRRPRNLSWLGQVILRRDRFIAEQSSGTRRYDLINAMIEVRGFRTYLEIGVRNPSDCFDRVRVERKWSVDPGFEVESNPATFPMTSDEFFERLGGGQLKDAPARWDAIFIDGAHRAEQVWRDIQNALRPFLRAGSCSCTTVCHRASRSRVSNTSGPSSREAAGVGLRGRVSPVIWRRASTLRGLSQPIGVSESSIRPGRPGPS